MQAINEAVDVIDWRIDEEFAQYPEGARDKTLIYCPLPSPYNFLKADRRYLFKLSSHRYAEQFWVEIFAYRLGVQMGISVPPAFVAYNSKTNQSAALIEWYLNRDGLLTRETSISGGDYCRQYIPDFDLKKGTQHNFETLEQIFTDLSKNHSEIHETWKTYWAKTLAFDALIGNTDRHQNNWCIIHREIQPPEGVYSDGMRFAPVFDNGTSLGHERLPASFQYDDESKQLDKYISKGQHHMKWRLSDDSKAGHLELVKNLAHKYPETRQVMLDCLKRVNNESFNGILNELVAFEVPQRLTGARAALMFELLKRRHQRLLNGLEN